MATRGVRSGSFSRAVLETAGASIAITALTAVGGLSLARVLGSTDRGIYAMISSFVTVAAVLGQFGIRNAVCFFIAKQREKAADFLRTSLWIMVVLGIATATIGVLVAPLIAGRTGQADLLRITFLAEPLIFLGSAWVFALQALDLPRWNQARLVQPAVYAMAVVVTAAAGLVNVTTAIACMILSILAQALYAWRVCCKVLPERGRADSNLLGPLLRYGGANLLSTSPYAVNYRFDQLVLAVVVAPAELGLYAVAVSLSSLVCPIAVAFGSVAMPRIAENLGQGKPISGRLMGGAVAGSALAGMIVATGLCISAPFTVPWILGPSYQDAVPLLWILTPASVVLGCNRVMGDLLRGCGKPLAVARGEGAAAVATLVLLPALVPVWGTIGAATASLVSYVLCGLILTASVRGQIQRGRRERRRNDDLAHEEIMNSVVA